MGNTLKTTFLLAVLTVGLVLAGDLLGGQQGMVMALVIAGVMNFVSYFFSDKIALAMYRAKPITRAELPRVYDIVERLCQRTGLPMPKLYVIPTESPNAFATGRNPKHASVAVTQGIVKLLNDEELEGVLAHELAHVKNRDILIGTVAATLAGAITMVARMAFWFGGSRDDDRGGVNPVAALAFMILAPLAAMLVQLAVSRSREYAADATGAQFTGNPYGLARALEKLDAYSKRLPLVATPSTAHMFIVKPAIDMGFVANLFSTHPPMEERVRRLVGRSAVVV